MLIGDAGVSYGSPEGTWCDGLIIRPDELIIRPDGLLIRPDELIIRPDGLLNCHTMSLRGFRTIQIVAALITPHNSKHKYRRRGGRVWGGGILPLKSDLQVPTISINFLLVKFLAF